MNVLVVSFRAINLYTGSLPQSQTFLPPELTSHDSPLRIMETNPEI